MSGIRRVLATDFGIWLALSDLPKLSDNMLRSAEHRAALANYLLLYDQLIIPTGNIQVLPVLRLMLGEDVFDELIKTKVIVLARYNHWFGYSGGGGGLGFFQITPGDRPDRGKNIGMSYFLPLEEAVDIAIAHSNPPSSVVRSRQISSLLKENIFEIPLESGMHSLTKEPYKDVAGSPYLREMLGFTKNDLNNLGKLPGNKVKIFNPHLPKEAGDSKEIRTFLRLAFENFILFCGAATAATDITGDDGTLTLVRAKGQRYGASIEGRNAFTEIQKLEGVPDIGKAFASGVLTADKILALRNSKHGESFRRWFGDGAPHEGAQEITNHYIEELGKPDWLDRNPAKTLRFAVTTAAGLLEPVTGTLLAAADNFLLSKWFPGKSPKLFMKQAKVMLAHQPVANSDPKGRDRNQPCYCGSGVKYKKCHGLLD